MISVTSSGMDRVDRPAKAAVDEERQAPAVIEMTVGQEDGVDLGRIERERLLVELCDVVSLERPAVDEDPPPARLDPMAAARHRERGARAEELHEATGSGLGSGAAALAFSRGSRVVAAR